MADLTYDPEWGHDPVIKALDAMTEALDQELRLTEYLSHTSDTAEEVQKLFASVQSFSKQRLEREFGPASPEEMERFLGEQRDRSIGCLGHLHRRLKEVRELRAALETGSPSLETVTKIYHALRSSILYEMVSWGSFLEIEINSRGSFSSLAPEIRKGLKRMCIYGEALRLGFDNSDHEWSEFPFDKSLE